jgi:hypothetical protein
LYKCTKNIALALKSNLLSTIVHISERRSASKNKSAGYFLNERQSANKKISVGNEFVERQSATNKTISCLLLYGFEWQSADKRLARSRNLIL